VQASLINGVQPLTASTTIGIVIQLLSNLFAIKRGDVEGDSKKRHLFTYALLIVPYIIFVVFTVVSVVLGNAMATDSNGYLISNSNLALPGVFYCLVIVNAPPSTGISRQLSL